MKKQTIQILQEAYKAETFSGRIVQTKRKNSMELPIFKSIEEQKQLNLFSK